MRIWNKKKKNTTGREAVESSKQLPKWYLQTIGDVENIRPYRIKRVACPNEQEELGYCIHEQGMHVADLSIYMIILC